MFQTIKNALKTPDVRKKLLYTLLLIVIFRLGCYITVPGVDSVALSEALGGQNGITGLIDLISGGAFSRLSLFAMSISPYITASIVIQLLAMVVPALERLSKEEGEAGRNKLNKYTKILTIVLALIESLGIYLAYKSSEIFVNNSFLTAALFVVSLIGGTSILMWLGDQITDKGIGNGISVIIFVGILAGLPGGLLTIYNLIFTSAGFSTTGLITALGIALGAVILIGAVVFVQEAERRVPVQYAKKLAMAGVLPIIFASSFLTFPAQIISMINTQIATQTGFWATIYKFSIATSSSAVPIGYAIANAIVYLVLIVAFTFFYTFATFNPVEVSNNIKRQGGFIPGIRAGKPTTEYLTSIISKITWFGGLYLAIIAILPMLLRFTSIDITFGGTSILIVVGVALEVVNQLESQLVMRHYKGFLE